MFERSSKKLGLDQAIFMGGAFDQTRTEEQAANNSGKLKKEEIETLLKQGLIGFLKDGQEQEMEKSEQFKNKDIDKILESSRTAKYSVLQGTYTFQKSSFTAEQTDTNLQVDDPDFWKKMLKNAKSESERILQTFEENSELEGHYADIDH